MPNKQRILVIVQLCLVFVIAGWNISYPFMGELFKFRSLQFLTANIEGKEEIAGWVAEQEQQEAKEKLKRQQERFSHFSTQDQELVLTASHWAEQKLQRSFIEKVQAAAELLFVQLSSYLQAWLFFAFFLSLFLLFQVTGAAEAAWILPFLTALLCIENHTLPPKVSPEATVYPSEKTLYTTYLHKEPSLSPSEQWEELRRGFSLYLASLTPEGSVEAGEQAFHLLQLKARGQAPAYGTASSPTHVSTPLLLLFLAWNLYFAYNMRNTKDSLCRKISVIPSGQLLLPP